MPKKKTVYVTAFRLTREEYEDTKRRFEKKKKEFRSVGITSLRGLVLRALNLAFSEIESEIPLIAQRFKEEK